MMRLLVRSVVWCRSDANSVLNRFKNVRSVQFTCLIGLAASSFSSVRGMEASASVYFVQFSSRHGGKCLPSFRSVQFEARRQVPPFISFSSVHSVQFMKFSSPRWNHSEKQADLRMYVAGKIHAKRVKLLRMYPSTINNSGHKMSVFAGCLVIFHVSAARKQQSEHIL